MKCWYNYKTIFFFCLLFLAGCRSKQTPPARQPTQIIDIAAQERTVADQHFTQSLPTTTVPDTLPKQHHCVIFIHGATTFIPSLQALKYAWRESSKPNSGESFYQHYQNNIRFGGYRKKQAIGCKGLWRIDLRGGHPCKIHHTIHTKEASTIARLYYHVLDTIEGSQLASCECYTFGWDGSLSVTSRKEAAKNLYRALHNQIKQHQDKYPNDTISIWLLGHSHGGNVALHLAEWEQQYKKDLYIDHLVLLGTPIQSETKHLIHAPHFKQVINLYSTGDWVQKLDCVSTKDFFSRRTFCRRSKYAHTNPNNVPDHVTDVEIRVDNYKPSHAELWFMGGIIHFFYRLKFPLYPFPVAIFAPCIAKILSQHGCSSKHLQLRMSRNESGFSFRALDKKHRRWSDKQFVINLQLQDLLHKITPIVT